jgi:uncharacterized protein (TIGR03083 family)
MDPTRTLAATLEGLADMGERFARLVEQLDHTDVPIARSTWTVRDAAAHLAGGSRRYAALIRGEVDVSAIPLDKEFLDARARRLLAADPETDPKKLAAQIREGFGDLLASAAGGSADGSIVWYAGLRSAPAAIVGIYLGEPLLHGYDVAAAVGVPWPIEPRYAALAVGAYPVMYPAIFQASAAAGLEATCRLEVAGTDPLCVRITGGTYAEVPDSSDVDCVISADPVTALLVLFGRLSRWPAIALGGLRFSGPRPEIGPRFFDLFLFP